MKRFICLMLCLCLLGGAGGAMAADLPVDDGADEFEARLASLWTELDVNVTDTLDELDLAALIAELRALARESAELDDETLRARIAEIAQAHGLDPDEDALQQYVKLFRSLERGAEVKEKAETAKEKAAAFFRSLRDFAHRAGLFFRRFGALLEGM